MNQNRNSKISDFVIARRVLELACKQHNCSFRDLEIDFGASHPHFDMADSGKICLSDAGTLPQTIYSLVSVYIDNLDAISGKPMSEESSSIVKNFALALVRDFTNTAEPISKKDRGDAHAMRLDQFAFVWMFLKNVICPYADLCLDNARIIAGYSGAVDGAVYVSGESSTALDRRTDQYPLIFVNLDIEVCPVRCAFLLMSAIEYMCDKSEVKIDPAALMRSIIFESNLKGRIIDYVNMVYPEAQDAADFFATLSLLCNSEDIENIAISTIQEEQSMTRTAQGMEDNWWFLGLTEKMLDPARSEDWTIYETWKPITQELWKKVEHERRIRGMDEVPFDLLLRIQSGIQTDGYQKAGTETLQGLLSEDRIW